MVIYTFVRNLYLRIREKVSTTNVHNKIKKITLLVITPILFISFLPSYDNNPAMLISFEYSRKRTTHQHTEFFRSIIFSGFLTAFMITIYHFISKGFSLNIHKLKQIIYNLFNLKDIPEDNGE